jgi:hypothetical protein
MTAAHQQPESPREKIANVAQILHGATPSALDHYRLLPRADWHRAIALLAAATKQLDAPVTADSVPDATGHA